MRKYLMDSNLQRRQFLKMIGYAGISATCLGILGCSRSENVKDLRFYGTGTLDIQEKWLQVQKDLGFNLMFEDNQNDVGPIITQMISGNSAYDYDIGGLQGGAERELAEAQVIMPWDLSKIPNWQNVWKWAKNIPYTRIDGKQFGLPIVVNADSMIYLPEKVGVIDTYAAIFDPKLKGKTSMEDSWINSAIFTAMYLKENGISKIKDPGDLEIDELEEVMEFLIQKKKEGQFKKFWSGWKDGVELMRSEEVYVMTGWEPIVYELRNKYGMNAEYAVPKEGYEGWSNDLVLHVGASQRGTIEMAHDFANWELGGFYGCVLGNERGYAVPNDSSLDFAKGSQNNGHCDVTGQQELLKRVSDKFQSKKGSIYWQNVRPKNFKLYEEWWAKLRAT
jgi:putative spermidine/putrescine transport system substrate-binding protein